MAVRKKNTKKVNTSVYRERNLAANIPHVIEKKKVLPEPPPIPNLQCVTTTPLQNNVPTLLRERTLSLPKKTPVFENLERVKKYFDISLGVVLDILLGAVVLGAFVGLLHFLVVNNVSALSLNFKDVLVCVFVSYLLGVLIREGNNAQHK